MAIATDPEAQAAPRELGRFIVADPAIRRGRLTFRGTWILVRQVLEQVALGMAWETIVAEWRGARPVDEPVLLDERQAVERGALDGHVEVVAAAGPVDDVDARVGKRLLEQRSDPLADHRRSC